MLSRAPRRDADTSEKQAMNKRRAEAITRAALGLPLTPAQEMVVAFERGGGCPSCGR